MARRRQSSKAGSQKKNSAIARRGLMLVLSSPSGAGKTTLVAHAARRRPAGRAVGLGHDAAERPGEVEGRDYHFIDQARFEAMVRAAANCWNGPKCSATATARRARRSRPHLAAGRDVLFDIDWQGTQQLREKARRDLVSIFVLPPSVPELERRLRTRAQDSTMP